jgi:putative nucleotidyltransferase with HDIG domain
VRDEVFKILQGANPAAALRLLDMLGALAPVFPDLAELKGVPQSPPHVLDAWEHSLDTVQRLAGLLDVLRPQHDPEGAANWALGLVSVRLGRFRGPLQEHLTQKLNPERSLRALLLLAALLHDIGKPARRQVDGNGKAHFKDHEALGAEMTRKIATAYRLSNAEVERLVTIVGGHMLPVRMTKAADAPSRREIYRFFRQSGAAGVDICLLNLADTLAVYGPGLPQEVWVRNLEVARSLLEGYWEKASELVSPPALLNGNDLMQDLRMEPGPKVGEILEAIREAQAAGEVSDRAQAIEMAWGMLAG